MPSREVSGRAGSGEGKRLNIEKRNVGGRGREKMSSRGLLTAGNKKLSIL